MNQQVKGQAMLLALFLGCIAFILLIDGQLVYRIVAATMSFVTIYGVFRLEKKKQQQLCKSHIQKIKHEKNEMFCEAFSQQRHDLLNDVQLLKSYIQLNKMDKLTACVESLKHRLMEESMLFKLGNLDFSADLYMLKLHWKSCQFYIEVCENDNPMAQTSNPEQASKAVMKLLHAISSSAKDMDGEPHELYMRFSVSNTYVELELEFIGAVNEDKMQQEWNSLQNDLSGEYQWKAEEEHRFIVRFPSK